MQPNVFVVISSEHSDADHVDVCDSLYSVQSLLESWEEEGWGSYFIRDPYGDPVYLDKFPDRPGSWLEIWHEDGDMPSYLILRSRLRKFNYHPTI